MKKIILLPIFFMAFYCLAIGQNKDSKPKKTQISIGPVINYNFGSITLGVGRNRAIRGLNLSNYNALGGGLVADFKFSNSLFLQTGLLYDTRTVTDKEFVSDDSSPYASVFKLKVSYVNIPLMLGYVFGNGNTQPYLSAGLQLGKGIGEEMSNEYTEELPSYISKNEPFVEFDGIEYGILGEVGIRHSIGQSKLLIFNLQYMGSDRGTFVNRANPTGGAVNIGTKRITANFAFLFKL